MKMLVFTDVHGDNKIINNLIKKSRNVDLLVCCGDITWFGDKLFSVIRRFKKTGKSMLLIPGNHESVKEIKNVAKKFDFVINLHAASYQLGDTLFFGYGNEGFKKVELGLEKIIPKFKKNLKKDLKIVFVTHGPAYGYKLDKLSIGHVGCRSFNKFINIINPKFHFCGHLHENFNIVDKIGRTFSINPGPGGRIISI